MLWKNGLKSKQKIFVLILIFRFGNTWSKLTFQKWSLQSTLPLPNTPYVTCYTWLSCTLRIHPSIESTKLSHYVDSVSIHCHHRWILNIFACTYLGTHILEDMHALLITHIDVSPLKYKYSIGLGIPLRCSPPQTRPQRMHKYLEGNWSASGNYCW